MTRFRRPAPDSVFQSPVPGSVSPRDPVVMTVVVVLALCLMDPVAALASTPSASGSDLGEQAGESDARMGPGVLEAVAAGGRVRVVVALALPERPSVPPASGAESLRDAFVRQLSASVEGVQERVLDRLPRGEFTLLRRYRTVPYLAAVASETAIRRLAALPEVVRIDVDPGGRGGGVLDDAKDLTNADEVNELGFTGEGITVAVLDSGLDRDHPDLQDDLADEACFCSDSEGSATGCCPNGNPTQTGAGAAEDDHGHGTHVTGIITSKGTVAPPGVAPDAEIIAVKVLDSNKIFCCASDVVAGLDWVAANHASTVDIVNMSLGTVALFSGDCDHATAFTMAFRDAVETLYDLGIVTFAAAMDGGSSTQMPAPACVQKALSVGAVDDSDVPAGFSNSNSVTDLFAPGETVLSTFLDGGSDTFSGTSMAAPHAAACAADLLQAAAAELSPGDIEARFESTGTSVVDPKNGLTFPRIDCLAALPQLRFWIAAFLGR